MNWRISPRDLWKRIVNTTRTPFEPRMKLEARRRHMRSFIIHASQHWLVVRKSQHAHLRTYGRRFSTSVMTEDAQLKEHNLRKLAAQANVGNDSTSAFSIWYIQDL